MKKLIAMLLLAAFVCVGSIGCTSSTSSSSKTSTGAGTGTGTK